MAEEKNVKSEHTEARLGVEPDTGRTGRGDNRNRNQRFRKTTDIFFGKTTDKFVGITKAIRGHIFESTSYGQADQYRKTLKEISDYSGTNLNSNVRK